MIAWFGPRGLSSLLLILLPVFAGATGSQQLFALCCLVVILSVAVHGGALMFLKRDAVPVQEVKAKSLTGDLLQNVQIPSTALDNATRSESAVRISVSELRQLQQSGAPVLVLDVRKDRSFESSDLRAQGALRISPDQTVQRLMELQIPRQTWLIAFCA